MPGPACPSNSTNIRADTNSEGFIHVQRGVHGVGDLAAADYDWRNPVAEVVVFAPGNDGNDGKQDSSEDKQSNDGKQDSDDKQGN